MTTLTLSFPAYDEDGLRADITYTTEIDECDAWVGEGDDWYLNEDTIIDVARAIAERMGWATEDKAGCFAVGYEVVG